MTFKEYDQSILTKILNNYRPKVIALYPKLAEAWPIVSGFDVKVGRYNDYEIGILIHTGNLDFSATSFVFFNEADLKVDQITDQNIEEVRNVIFKQNNLTVKDGVIILKKDNSNLKDEINQLFRKHQAVMGVKPTQIFLSRSGTNNEIIYDYKNLLDIIGYDIYFNDNHYFDLKEIFKYTKGAIFLLTENNIDDEKLIQEVELAILEKEKKDQDFTLITLVLDDTENTLIPIELTDHPIIYPENHLQAIIEIITAFPNK